MPLLSIIVPVYNTKKYIHQCLDSVVTQYNEKFELIIVDDGSTDECSAICDEYAEKYSFIKVVHKANGGLLMARRTGIEEAQGEYLMHIDSDDYLLDGAIDALCNAVGKNPCDMVIFDFVYGADAVKPERIIRIWDDSEIVIYDEKNSVLKKFLVGGNLNAMWMKVTRRAVVDVERDYSQFSSVANGEDVLQSMALFDSSESFLYIPTPMYYYRRDNVSMSKVYGTKDYYSFRMVNEQRLEYAARWNMPDELIVELTYTILDKNMVILHQVRKNESKQSLNKLLKVMSEDSYFTSLKVAMKSKNINSYYRVLFALISKKHYILAKAFMNAVALLKR